MPRNYIFVDSRQPHPEADASHDALGCYQGIIAGVVNTQSLSFTGVWQLTHS